MEEKLKKKMTVATKGKRRVRRVRVPFFPVTAIGGKFIPLAEALRIWGYRPKN